jgi:hypothetical protein
VIVGTARVAPGTWHAMMWVPRIMTGSR